MLYSTHTQSSKVRLPMSETSTSNHGINIYSYGTIVHNGLMYILEQRSSCGTWGLCPSWPRSEPVLNPALAPSYEHASCCHDQPGV
jgi:hypothetical protein